ncbi:MAG: glycosyltransferase family 39 protein [Bryobacterales bacterium]|nr:glycosyltransferase family 39 protein [Bryobacterales bacterium]
MNSVTIGIDRLRRSVFPGITDRLQILLILAAGGLLGALTLVYVAGGNDIPLFLYIGDGLLHGMVPYRDAWDVKGPGIFFAFGLCALWFGHSGFAVHLFDLVWQTGTALVLARIAQRVFKSPAAGLIAGLGYLIAYFSQPWWSLAAADGLISLPVALGMLALVRALESGRASFWTMAGAAAGIATLFKTPFGLVGIPMMACAFARREGSRQVLVRLSCLAAGFTGPLALCLAYFYLRGALGDLLTAHFVYATEYVRAARERLTLACAAGRTFSRAFLPLHVMLSVALAFAALRRLRGRPAGAMLAALWSWLAVAAAALAMHGLFLEYHFFPLIAPLAVISAGGVLELVRAALASRRRLAAVLLVITLAVFGWEPSKRIRGHFRNTVQGLRRGVLPPSEWVKLGDYLREHTSGDGTIFVWGNAASVYLRARRKPASRFLGIWPFALPIRDIGYHQLFLREFQANRPEYFVLVKYPPVPAEPACQLPINPNSLQEFEPLNRMIAAQYSAVEETSSYILFRRRA